MPRHPLFVLGCAVVLAACQAPPPASRPAASPPLAARATRTPGVPAGLLVGVVKAPAGVIGQSGSAVIGQNGANVIGQSGSAVIGQSGSAVIGQNGASLAGRGLLALEEVPLAGVEVFLADAAGNPVPGLAATKTDAQGRYAFAAVPAGYNLLVVARFPAKSGGVGRLETVVSTGPAGATADLGAASTLVTAAVAEAANGTLGAFDARSFAAAVALTAGKLDAAALPDFADRKAVREAMQRLIGDVAELRTLVTDLRAQLARHEAKLDALAAAIAALKREEAEASAAPASPAASAEAAPSAPPSPSAPPPASPSASPTPRPVVAYAGLGAPALSGRALVRARSEACAAVVGRYLYVVGGRQGDLPLSSVERAPIGEDGSLGRFEEVAGGLGVPRSQAACVQVGRRLLVVGGFGGPKGEVLGSLEGAPIQPGDDLSPFTSGFADRLMAARAQPAIAPFGTELFVAGGRAGADGALATLEKVALKPDGTVLLGAGGGANYQLRVARRAAALLAIRDRLVAVGGFGADGAPLASVEAAPVTRSASGQADPKGFVVQAARLAIPRGGPAAVVLGDRLFVVGGEAAGADLTFERADLDAAGAPGAFAPLTPASTVKAPRGFAAAAARDALYLVGGESAAGEAVSTVIRIPFEP